MTLLLEAAAYLPPTNVGRPTRELPLHESVLRAAPLLLPRVRGARVAVREFAIRGARPDAVVVDVDLSRLAERTAAGLEPLASTVEIAVQALFRRGRDLAEETVVELASRYTSPAKARSALRRLLRRGYIVTGERGLRLSEAARPALRRSVAVEAKVGDCRAAERQARRWRLMFDAACLAFPAVYAEQVAPNLPGVAMYGVLAVGANGEVDVVIPPPTRRADAFSTTLVEEAFYARALEERDMLRRDLFGEKLGLIAAYS